MGVRISNMTILTGGTKWISDGAFQFDLEARANTMEEVLQNCFNTLSTPLGSQVLLRSFGLSQLWIDQPGAIGQFQARTAALLSVGLWEPRAKVASCDFSLDTNDVMGGSYSLYLQVEIDLSQAVTTTLFNPPSAVPIWVLDAPFDPNGNTVPTVQSEVLNIYQG